MAYKWRPSASQRRAFAQRMQDPAEKAAYEQRILDKIKKRKASSQFDYNTAGGTYVPTREQHDFALENNHLARTAEEEAAFNDVMYGYSCQERVHHDSIHIVNEARRRYHA